MIIGMRQPELVDRTTMAAHATELLCSIYVILFAHQELQAGAPPLPSDPHADRERVHHHCPLTRMQSTKALGVCRGRTSWQHSMFSARRERGTLLGCRGHPSLEESPTRATGELDGTKARVVPTIVS